MTKLLIATGIFHPESGGPATYLYHLLPHLQEHGYEVQVITYSDTPDATNAYPYPVTRIPRTGFPSRQMAYAQAARPLMQWADLIYMHTLMLPLPWMPLEKRKPRVMKIVGDQAWERSIRNGWVSPLTDIDRFQFTKMRHPMVGLSKNLRKHEVRRMDGVIVPSQYLKQMVTHWGMSSTRVQVIYNALPPENVPKISQADARAQLNLAPTQKIILTVGRLVPWKGVDDFMMALKSLHDVHLLIAGDGDYRQALEDFAAEHGVSERVTFLGRVPREQMPIYMRAADYVGLYSGYEGLSHVLLESLRVGTPVIASNKGGNPEVVTQNVNGLLVPYEQPQALAEAIAFAFKPNKREQLAANTQLGLEKFDYDRMVFETIGALETFLEKVT